MGNGPPFGATLGMDASSDPTPVGGSQPHGHCYRSAKGSPRTPEGGSQHLAPCHSGDMGSGCIIQSDPRRRVAAAWSLPSQRERLSPDPRRRVKAFSPLSLRATWGTVRCDMGNGPPFGATWGMDASSDPTPEGGSQPHGHCHRGMKAIILAG